MCSRCWEFFVVHLDLFLRRASVRWPKRPWHLGRPLNSFISERVRMEGDGSSSFLAFRRKNEANSRTSYVFSWRSVLKKVLNGILIFRKQKNNHVYVTGLRNYYFFLIYRHCCQTLRLQNEFKLKWNLPASRPGVACQNISLRSTQIVFGWTTGAEENQTARDENFMNPKTEFFSFCLGFSWVLRK